MEMCRLLGPGWEGWMFCGRRGQRCCQRGQIAGSSALYATRFLFGTWARGGLRVESNKVIDASTCHISQGSEGPTRLTDLSATLVSENYFVSSFDLTVEQCRQLCCEARTHEAHVLDGP